jgi:hypothetical protein
MTLGLRDENGQVLPEANLGLIIEPRPTAERLPTLQQARRNIRELMTSIKEAPLPQGWEEKTTADGRTYFERTGDKKITIAYDFSVRLEEHLEVRWGRGRVRPRYAAADRDFLSLSAKYGGV